MHLDLSPSVVLSIMEPLGGDLKELLSEYSEFMKAFLTCNQQRSDLKKHVKILTEKLKVSQSSEEKMLCMQKQKQETITELQNILNGYLNVKEENEKLKVELKKTKELLEEENKSFLLDKMKWTEEKDNLIKTNREEIENLKKIRNMEVSSLNREISHIQEEQERKIELIRNNIENDHKNQLSRSIMSYEERLAKLSRELISTQSQLQNARNDNNIHANHYSVEEVRPVKDRYIPQPLSYTRYKPIVPIFSMSSQMYKTGETETETSTIETKNLSPPSKKKKKLYTRTDDIL